MGVIIHFHFRKKSHLYIRLKMATGTRTNPDRQALDADPTESVPYSYAVPDPVLDSNPVLDTDPIPNSDPVPDSDPQHIVFLQLFRPPVKT
jgi:hypothetical protein